MRVLLLNARYDGGGAERCGRELFQHLPQVGIETDLWVCQPSRATPPSVRSLPMFWEDTCTRSLSLIRRLARQATPRFRPRQALAATESRDRSGGQGFSTTLAKWKNQRHIGFRRRLAEIEPGDFDLVHLHATYTDCAALNSLKQLAHKLPVVWTLHDTCAVTGGVLHDLSDSMSAMDVRTMLMQSGQSDVARLYHRAFLPKSERDFIRDSMPKPVVAIAPSHDMQQKARRSDLLERVEIQHIPNPTVLLDHPSAQLSRLQARRELGLATERPVVLMTASDLSCPHKGLWLGLQALNALRDPLPQLVLMGASNTRGFRGPGYRGPIKTLMARDSQELGRVYRAADVTLIPSLTENLPYTALESLACQTPIVAFQVGGLAEIVASGRGGLLVPPFEIPIMSACLSRLLVDHTWNQRLGEFGQRWVHQHCGLPDYLNRMKGVYQTAVQCHERAIREPQFVSTFPRAA